MTKYKGLFKQLLAAHGGPGFEEEVRNLILPHLSEYATEMWTDALGNLIGLIPGTGTGRRPRILVSAHIDEIALVVTRVESGGFLRLAPSGGFDPRALVGQEVVVHAASGRMWGVVGAKPPHLTSPSERSKAPKLEDLYVDLALPEEEVRSRVRVGDRVTIQRAPFDLLNGRIAGKSVDNRASAAVLLESLHLLRGMAHEADLYAVFTVQEEVGLRGAQTAGFGLMPDIAIALDVTFGAFPGQPADASFALESGVAISFGPNLHRKVFRRLVECADRHRIPYQVELSQRPVGADANAFQIAGPGLATALIGPPIRYMHTSVETVAYDDIWQCARLLAHYVAEVDASQVEELTCY
ncbi:M42 family metallopeptidase [Alicyclobacillus vulcanalis]|uniref:Endoglucanase n=1 Tax=Alicyclobacillus vulcanalis TaxID=252246 RepID=A0A1N7NDJ0_9BACL|nr:M20/M25/M40 family metallo-hydrolase [Alicyclobacillus vulcanalis]SIS96390.1 endoglucanase [Alicyclobacillus vulcanalis]